MTQQTAIAPTPTVQSTCATCPKFKDYQDRGRGLCLISDKVVRKHHTLTNDCVQQIESEQLELLLSTHKAFLKPIALNFPGRNVFKQDPEGSYSKVGYVGKNMVGWFANDRHGFTVIGEQPSQLKALEILLNR